MDRITRKAAEAAVEGMTAAAIDAGLMAEDASFVIYGAYGGWAIRGTGGYLGTGQTEITGLGSLRSVYESAHAFTAALRFGANTLS